MNSNQILWPVLAQISLTLIMFIVLGKRKARARKTKEVDLKKSALDSNAWPEYVRKVTNNIANQFEIPMLFYVLCILIYNLEATSILTVGLAWFFTLTRYAHAYIHIGSNYVPTRMKIYTLGCLIIIALLVLVALNLATSTMKG